jgi:uncharacterized protein YjaG (DUF416 family)
LGDVRAIAPLVEAATQAELVDSTVTTLIGLVKSHAVDISTDDLAAITQLRVTDGEPDTTADTLMAAPDVREADPVSLIQLAQAELQRRGGCA